jgi:hypothetical protein
MEKNSILMVFFIVSYLVLTNEAENWVSTTKGNFIHLLLRHGLVHGI